jgi:hypothetical protein
MQMIPAWKVRWKYFKCMILYIMYSGKKTATFCKKSVILLMLICRILFSVSANYFTRLTNLG